MLYSNSFKLLRTSQHYYDATAKLGLLVRSSVIIAVAITWHNLTEGFPISGCATSLQAFPSKTLTIFFSQLLSSSLTPKTLLTFRLSHISACITFNRSDWKQCKCCALRIHGPALDHWQWPQRSPTVHGSQCRTSDLRLFVPLFTQGNQTLSCDLL